MSTAVCSSDLKMDLVVRTLYKTVILNGLDGNSDISDVKNLLFYRGQQEHIPIPAPAKQRLVFQGNVLTSGRLQSAGIRSGDHVVLLLHRPNASSFSRPVDTTPVPTAATIRKAIIEEARQRGIENTLTEEPNLRAFRPMEVDQQLMHLMQVLRGRQPVGTEDRAGQPRQAAGVGGAAAAGGQQQQQQPAEAGAGEGRRYMQVGMMPPPGMMLFGVPPAAVPAAPPPAAIPEPDAQAAAQLGEMGFGEAVVRKALLLHRNEMEAALNWLLQHGEDPAAAEPLTDEQLRQIYSRGPRGPPSEPELVEQLVAMGFERNQSMAALRRFRNMDMALAYLLRTAEEGGEQQQQQQREQPRQQQLQPPAGGDGAAAAAQWDRGQQQQQQARAGDAEVATAGFAQQRPDGAGSSGGIFSAGGQQQRAGQRGAGGQGEPARRAGAGRLPWAGSSSGGGDLPALASTDSDEDEDMLEGGPRGGLRAPHHPCEAAGGEGSTGAGQRGSRGGPAAEVQVMDADDDERGAGGEGGDVTDEDEDMHDEECVQEEGSDDDEDDDDEDDEDDFAGDGGMPTMIEQLAMGQGAGGGRGAVLQIPVGGGGGLRLAAAAMPEDALGAMGAFEAPFGLYGGAPHGVGATAPAVAVTRGPDGNDLVLGSAGAAMPPLMPARGMILGGGMGLGGGGGAGLGPALFDLPGLLGGGGGAGDDEMQGMGLVQQLLNAVLRDAMGGAGEGGSGGSGGGGAAGNRR